MVRLRRIARKIRALLRGLRAFLILKPWEWVLIINAYWWLFRARRLMNQLKGDQWFQPSGKPKEYTSPVMAPIDQRGVFQRAVLVSFASAAPYQWALCLQRSVALREWLAKGGMVTELKLGVQRDKKGAFMAHAWLEHEGKIINDTSRFIGTFAKLIKEEPEESTEKPLTETASKE